MKVKFLILPLIITLTLLSTIKARRVRIRPQPVQQQEQEIEEISDPESNENDNRPQPAIQYYNTDLRPNIPRDGIVLVSSDDDYNGIYGQTTPRARIDYNRPSISSLRSSSTQAPRTKDQGTKSPPVQTIRNYSKVNDDGSFTFGYEAADGSFKEETRGTDCVVRGKYGYIDPDGNKREFTYVSGNPCDPNNPDEHESEEERENSEEENIPQNYPQRPVRPIRPARPIHTTTNTPETVFQNNYAHPSIQETSDEDEHQQIQVLQSRPRITNGVQPLSQRQTEVAIRQRPRVTVVNTTPSPDSYFRSSQAVSITPRPTYRTPIHTLQTQPPATTYRPAIKLNQTPATLQYAKHSNPPNYYPSVTTSTVSTLNRRPVDFAAELQKFHDQHNIPVTTSTVKTTTPLKAYKTQRTQKVDEHATSNPIYESQLIFDPSSGQYNSALYQQLPQTDGNFQINHRIQPYVYPATSTASSHPSLVSLDQLQQINSLYRNRPVHNQYSQDLYEKDRENLQVLNSQQLYEQQQQLQQQQLQQDRLEASRKTQQAQSHRFQPQRQISTEEPQGFYYIQPQTGPIDAFLRGHNIGF